MTDPGLPKAGVYAVRQEPTLIANLRARVMGGSMRRYRPQRDLLSLLNLGDGRALASKWGVAVEGAWAFTVSDCIDRRFVRRFQVLGPAGDLQAEFARAPAMAQDMICGGCAAKVGESVLTRALDRLGAVSDPDVVLGLAVPDDAAAVATARGEIDERQRVHRHQRLRPRRPPGAMLRASKAGAAIDLRALPHLLGAKRHRLHRRLGRGHRRDHDDGRVEGEKSLGRGAP